MNNKKTIFITGGGTGGHIYPAIAVYKELKNQGHILYYIGNKNKLEYGICTQEGFNFLPVNVDGMPRKFSLKFIFWLFKTLYASIVAISYVKKHKPDAIFATGGYVSAPSLIAANILNIPYMLHDCDSHPGIVSRVFAKRAKRVSTAFSDAKKHIRNKDVIFNGNPIRDDFLKISKREAREELGIPEDKFTILVMGGSQGAKTINSASKKLIDYAGGNEYISLIIQTGKKNYDDFIKEVTDIPKNVIIKPYFDKMAIPLIASDLVVSRAGSLSLSEICASSSPSILIPYPYAAANHQKLNADVMVKLGASVCIEDKDCEEKLLSEIQKLLNERENLDKMRECAIQNARLNATRDITNQLLEIAK